MDEIDKQYMMKEFELMNCAGYWEYFYNSSLGSVFQDPSCGKLSLSDLTLYIANNFCCGIV